MLLAFLAVQEPHEGGELILTAYVGQAWTLDGDLELDRGAEELTFQDVSWEDESFRSPIYYGLRAAWFFDSGPGWGIALDFTHIKVFLEEEEVVELSGSRGGRERIGDTIAELGISHGLNVVTANVLYRGRWGPAWPYAGVGAGLVVAHVEASLDGRWVSEYQLDGPAVQALAGVAVDLSTLFSVFVEAKVGSVEPELDVPGGSIRADLLTPQVVAGLSLRL